jgi:hypothetical protein
MALTLLDKYISQQPQLAPQTVAPGPGKRTQSPLQAANSTASVVTASLDCQASLAMARAAPLLGIEAAAVAAPLPLTAAPASHGLGSGYPGSGLTYGGEYGRY